MIEFSDRRGVSFVYQFINDALDDPNVGKSSFDELLDQYVKNKKSKNDRSRNALKNALRKNFQKQYQVKGK